jgi:hypothetical protein
MLGMDIAFAVATLTEAMKGHAGTYAGREYDFRTIL